jgi:hypothetical protein
MSLFDDDLFYGAAAGYLGQTTTETPDPTRRTVEPPAREEPKTIMGSDKERSGGLPRWAPFALVGAAVLFAGVVVATSASPRRVSANRRRRRR